MTTDSPRKIYKLTDEFITQVAKVLQLSMLTQTNIVDHMRQMRLEESPNEDNALALTPEYGAWFDKSIKQLLDHAQELMKLDDLGAAEAPPSQPNPPRSSTMIGGESVVDGDWT